MRIRPLEEPPTRSLLIRQHDHSAITFRFRSELYVPERNEFIERFEIGFNYVRSNHKGWQRPVYQVVQDAIDVGFSRLNKIYLDTRLDHIHLEHWEGP